jgi:DNA-binding NtrC family response regulator
MLRVFQILDRIIDTHVPVLIHGQSGTGKELIARAIHFNGPRKAAPFISVNCGAIPESLLESELFGHVRGAFTGATTDREGLLPAADRGSLFLDEIGDMSLAMQTKLLRALQEGEVRPVGASEDRHVDVRIIAASHRDLGDEVAAGRFREDLYYRVNVVRINLPSLKERPDDIPVLAEHLLERCAGELGGVRKRLTPDAIEALMKFDWPGNVRELENLLKNAAVLSTGAEIKASDFPISTSTSRVTEATDTLNLAELERQAIHRALNVSKGNKKKAAELLGIARLTLYRKLKGYESE